MKKALLVSIIVTIVCVSILGYQKYVLWRDVESVAHRAQVAADVSDMLEYMTQLERNMTKHNMTTGHTALVFKSPANDLGELHLSIKRIIERLESIKDMPKNSIVYQTALDDMRGNIRELEAPSDGYIWVHYWPLVLLSILIWIYPIVLFLRNDTW